MNTFSSKTFLRFKFAGDPQIDPSGNRIAFTLSHSNEKKDGYDKSIYMYDGNLFQFTKGPSDSSPRWSPDGKEIAFISASKDEKGSNLMLIRSDGGESVKIAHFDDQITDLAWLNSNELILSVALKAKRKSKEGQDDVHEIEKIPFWSNGEGFTYDVKIQLYLVGKNGTKKCLTKESGDIFTFAPSPDGKNVAFVEALDLERDPLVSDLFVLKIGFGEPKKITNSDVSIGNICWSPNSKEMAVAISDLKHGSFTNERLWITNLNGNFTKICDVDLAKGNSINSDSRGGSPNKIFWRDSGIYFMMTDGPLSKIYKFFDGKVSEIIGEERSVSGFNVAPNGNIVFLSMNFTSLDEIYLYKNGKEKKISRLNDLRNFSISVPEHFDVISSDGKKIDAWIMKPTDFQKGKKYPTILEVHGGPRTAYGNAFFLEFQMLTSNGFAVLFSNPRGSDGYGEEFSYIHGAYGKRDYKDIMEVVDEAIKRFDFVDEKRLGITGGSYGGYMTNWVVTQTDRFKAAVSQRSISNWVSFFGTTDIGYFFGPDQLGGDPWSNPDGYAEMSPLTYVKNVKTPIMFIHSMEDYRCYMVEAFQFFTALRYLNKEAKLALFPSENHELSRSGKPYHRIKRLDLILDWFKKHLEI
ncbi:MAG: S9 family peptidase [Thermotogae bacterium]|jgi:dipeptidyl aminopeptidase/acylaminoacyl peptidase|nr:S9 family peptidase [Thermotogota bacterium]MCL5032899.1 S9 family peptidase [Thermotogota bacterium]